MLFHRKTTVYLKYSGQDCSKNKLFFSTSFGRGHSQGICRICDLQVLKDVWHYFTTDIGYFGPYAETKNNGGERKVCMKWIQFRSWFRPSGAKVSSFIIQKFSRCFSLSFNVSVDVVRMFLSCSMIISVIVKVMIVLVEMFASWYCIVIFDIFSVVIEHNVEWCF